ALLPHGCGSGGPVRARPGSLGAILPSMSKELRQALFVLLCCAAAVGAQEPKKTPVPVEVHLTEYAIAMPKTLPAGPTTFALSNDGQKSHSFKIEGPGLD